MKKLLAVLLTLGMLLTVPALAEEGLYLREVPQYTYVSETLLTEECFPEVHLAPYSVYNFFGASNAAEPKFICFSGPEGTLANEFDVDFATYLDESNAIQYYYVVNLKDSWEEFVNNAAAPEYVLLDGSDGMAAYIDPDKLVAYGMLATTEFGPSSKLTIRMKLDTLSTRMPLEQRIEALTDAILPEVERVKDQMHYETYETFWSEGLYTGWKCLDEDDFDHMLKLDFPALELYYSDGSAFETDLIVTELRFGTLYGVYDYGQGMNIKVEISMDDNPYAIHELEEDKDPDAQVVTLDNGQVWYIYMSGLTERGQSTYCYGSTPLGLQNRSEREYYLTVKFDASNIYWQNAEDFVDTLMRFDSCYETLSAADDPYVPQEKPASASEPEAPASADGETTQEEGAWTCPECGSQNTGNFCPECGTAKPVSPEWTCPNCGTVSEGNFCPECGTARP